MTEDGKFWKTIIYPGGGSLKEFQADYAETDEVAGQFIAASNIFPILSEGYSLRDDNNKPVYEWVLFVKRDPNFQKVLDNKGKVKETLNEKEGRKIDPKVEEEVVI